MTVFDWNLPLICSIAVGEARTPGMVRSERKKQTQGRKC